MENVGNQSSFDESTRQLHTGDFYVDPKSNFWLPVFIASPILVWLVSICTFIFAAVGFGIYIRSAFILLKFSKAAFANPFYTIVLYLALPDCLYLFIQLAFGIPTTILGFPNVPFHMGFATGFISEISMCSLFGLISLMGINRYVAICHFDKYTSWFSRWRVHSFCCLCFLLGLVISAGDDYCECFSLKVDFSYKLTCKVDANGEPKCSFWVVQYDYVFWGFFTVFIPSINFVTVTRYFLKRRQIRASLDIQDNWKKDAALLFQFISISAVFVIYMATFWIEDQVGSSNNPLDITITLLSILNSSVNPYLYLAFNSDIRAKFWERSSSHLTTASRVTVQTLRSNKIEDRSAVSKL